jgi:hypothetical protein
MLSNSRYSRRNSWYCLLISRRDCNLPFIRVCRAVAICNESSMSIGGSALKGSLTVYIPPTIREWVEMKCLSHCSSSLRGSFWEIISSSYNSRNKTSVSHSAVQSDTWALSALYGGYACRTRNDPAKDGFLNHGASVGPKRGSSRTNIDENRFDPINKWIGCWLDGSGSASSTSLRWGHTPKDHTLNLRSRVNCNTWKHIRR